MLKRLALWLCRVAGIPATETLDETRLKVGHDAILRGQRWESFYREERGLADILADLRKEAFEAAADLDPREIELIRYWMIADRNLRRLQLRIENIVTTGRAEVASQAQLERDHAARIIRQEF